MECETTNISGAVEPQRLYSQEPVTTADRTSQIQSDVGSIQHGT